MILITYDLKQPGQYYEPLYAAVKSLGAWWHYLESTWLVATSETVAGVAGKLMPNIDQNDNLLIIEVNPRNKQGWLPEKAWEWINTH